MAIRFLLDEQLRGPLWWAIERHNARGQYPIDAVRVGDPPDLPLGTSDPDILVWAEGADRILVSVDRSTLPDHLDAHLKAEHHSPGVLLLRRGSSWREVLTLLELIAHASEPDEWRDQITWL